MLKVFIGLDHRQLISYNVLQQSVFRNSSLPVAITPLVINKPPFSNALVKHQLPLERQGLTPFTFTRFLVPYLCNYEGWALFLDADILLRADIAELFALADDKYTAMVSKNKIAYEWASVILFNCARCQVLTPDYISTARDLHTIAWASDADIGDLPREWNHLVGYDKPRSDAKLIHYTQGVPCFPETQDSEYAHEWQEEHGLMNSSAPWVELMGNSKHVARLKHPDGKIEVVPIYKVEPPQ